MDDVLIRKFPNDQKITIRNPKDNRVITRPWISAKHLVDRGWKIIGSEAEPVKKSVENVVAPVAKTVTNNPDLFTEGEAKAKYEELYSKKPFWKWDKKTIIDKILGHGKQEN